MNKVRPLSFTAHAMFNRLQREKSEHLRRMLEIDQELTNLINGFGYQVQLEEVEEHVTKIQQEHTLRLSRRNEVQGEILGVGVKEKGTWSFIRDNSVRDPMLIASIECMIERLQFISSLDEDDVTGAFYFIREQTPTHELELLGENAPKITPQVPEQPAERRLAKPIPTAPQPVKAAPVPPKEAVKATAIKAPKTNNIRETIEKFRNQKGVK